MTDHDIKILMAMKRYGGSFASSIAQAALAADSTNYARLKAAFPDLWDSYERFIEIRNASGKVD